MALIMIDNEYSTLMQPPFATREANGTSELFMSKYRANAFNVHYLCHNIELESTEYFFVRAEAGY